MAKPRLLITGASGFLGSWLGKVAQADWHVSGQYRRSPGTDPSLDWYPADLCQAGATEALLDRTQPSAVAHLAAISSTPACQAHPADTAAVNVGAAIALAQHCAQRHIPLVFTSTDLVFDGDRPGAEPYREDDPINPLNEYGRQKAAAELGIQEAHPGAIILRLPLLFGFQRAAPNNFMAQILTALQTGEPIQLFTDEVRNPLSAQAAAEGVNLALQLAYDHRHRGLLHLGGPEAVSRYELGCLLAQVKGYASHSLQPCRQADVMLTMARPRWVCTDWELARSFGFAPPSLRQQLEES